MNNSDLCDVWEDLANIPADPPAKRILCLRCRRPSTVCWCPFLPREPVDVKSTIVVLQHPGEEKRCLRTAPMLEFALPAGQFYLLKGRRFSSQTSAMLQSIFNSPNTVLFYPGTSAISMDTISEENCESEGYNIVILDGTWPQARSIYSNSEELRNLKQVQINSKSNSEYVIRTQPTERALSTVETAAVALANLEHKPYLTDVLVKPLKALCRFQLAYGAVTHHSKEYLIKNGLYKSQKKISLPEKEFLV